MSATARYPFSAVVGMDDLKLALLINAVSPGVGGVLVRGEKGTAKSTIVRALAALLPDLDVVAGCRFSCDPRQPDPDCPDGPHTVDAETTHSRPARLVELPVGASEDRLAGSLDIERALTSGVKAFEPGLLAEAHRGALYVDEVNLLHDHLVDLLLDAAAMGVSHVEREGVSVSHAARFLLVGTMNPEEGELRPQLLDRFGLTVEATATREPAERAEVVRRRLAFEENPSAFAAQYAEADAELATSIRDAQQRLGQVQLTDTALEQVTAVCAAFDVDGLRADLVTARAATALAAWRAHPEVTTDDVRDAARLALPHRRRRDPFDAPDLDEDRLQEALDQAGDADPKDTEGAQPPSPGDTSQQQRDAGETEQPPDSGTAQSPADSASGSGTGAEGQDDGSQKQPQGAREPEDPEGTYRPPVFRVDGMGSGTPGRRSRAETPQGRISGSRVPRGRVTSPHLTATLRAAAPHQQQRGRVGGGLVLRSSDLREAVREGREGNLVLFCVDASGSMAARRRMRAVKGAVLSLLMDAYQRRDKVGLVTFRGAGAELALPPTSSVEAGARRLRDLRTGGRTPLGAGLRTAAETVRNERLRDPRRRPLLILVTDGRSTHGGFDEALRMCGWLRSADVESVVVDCEAGPVRLGNAGRLATALAGNRTDLNDLASSELSGIVRQYTQPNQAA
ncbi:putative cobaltochelatase [Lipingzhangella sp. LS1_29]|uniref:Mg-protoporphyrin IX chelatase n=1 Tax=Lipingzhangella rawalii TaxID=2055835 RepID=A0ABU2H6Z1_9ACTN|nr:putative cobaltochelatase [Lipingzhangella rawalii]MDS1271073.1 putative cobaltochelatase [Lipingzhangella rawalii]